MIHIHFIFIAIPLILIWLFYRVNIIRKTKTINKVRESFINIFFIYFLIVINLTFFKQGYLMLTFDRITYINLIPFVETIKMFQNNFMGIGNSLYNVIGNIVLFIPLGFLIPLLFKNKNKLINIVTYGFIFSLSIEVLQFLTATNLTDIDDIIFNTLGAIIGYFVFNIFIKVIKKTKLIILIDKITTDCVDNFLLLSLKLLIPMTLVSIILIFTVLYFCTTSDKLTDKAIAKDVFSYNVSDNYVAFVDFDDYKLCLAEYGNYIDLLSAKKVLTNRWTEYGGAYQLNLSNNDYGYSIATISKNDYKDLAIIVFGENLDASSIEIVFNGKKYSQELKPNDYFIVPFPTFETIPETSDIYNIFEGEESKDLTINFKEKDGTECEHLTIN